MSGRRCTCPSRTIANCSPVPTSAREISAKVSVPSPSKSRLTTQLDLLFCGIAGSASLELGALDHRRASRRYFDAPSSSQVTSGWSGSSSTAARSAPEPAGSRWPSEGPSEARGRASGSSGPRPSRWRRRGRLGRLRRGPDGRCRGRRGLGRARWLAEAAGGRRGARRAGRRAGPPGRGTPSGCRPGSVGVGGGGAGTGGRTSRNRSWACRLTVSTRSRRLVPGISTTMFWLPWVVTSASATPEPLTRCVDDPGGLSRFSSVTPSPLGDQGDPGAALQVEAELGRPGHRPSATRPKTTTSGRRKQTATRCVPGPGTSRPEAQASPPRSAVCVVLVVAGVGTTRRDRGPTTDRRSTHAGGDLEARPGRRRTLRDRAVDARQSITPVAGLRGLRTVWRAASGGVGWGRMISSQKSTER